MPAYIWLILIVGVHGHMLAGCYAAHSPTTHAVYADPYCRVFLREGSTCWEAAPLRRPQPIAISSAASLPHLFLQPADLSSLLQRCLAFFTCEMRKMILLYTASGRGRVREGVQRAKASSFLCSPTSSSLSMSPPSSCLLALQLHAGLASLPPSLLRAKGWSSLGLAS